MTSWLVLHSFHIDIVTADIWIVWYKMVDMWPFCWRVIQDCWYQSIREKSAELHLCNSQDLSIQGVTQYLCGSRWRWARKGKLHCHKISFSSSPHELFRYLRTCCLSVVGCNSGPCFYRIMTRVTLHPCSQHNLQMISHFIPARGENKVSSSVHFSSTLI